MEGEERTMDASEVLEERYNRQSLSSFLMILNMYFFVKIHCDRLFSFSLQNMSIQDAETQIMNEQEINDLMNSV